MSSLPNIDTGHLVDFLVKLLNIPSPTGRTDDAIAFVEKNFPHSNNSNSVARAKARWSQNGKAGKTIHRAH